MPTRIKLALGGGQFGLRAQPIGSKVNTVEDAQRLVDLFVSSGNDKLDTSRIYGGGTSEELISKIDLKGCTVDTKIYSRGPGGLKAEKVREELERSVKALGGVKIQTFYLHNPDRSTPIDETLRAVNDLYKEGTFEEFGLSNFASWEVAEAVCAADRHGWIKPTVYQGVYNIIERTVEDEHIVILSEALWNPILRLQPARVSGMLSGHILTEADMKKPGGRWDPNVSVIAEMLQKGYGPKLPVLMELKDSLDKMNVTLSQAAFTWLQHHSKLDPEAGDRIIIGASNPIQLESNLKDSNGDPLAEAVVKLLNDTWLKLKPIVRHYAAL